MKDYQEKRVLVTGGAGFIGSELVKQLAHEGAVITVLDDFSSGKKHYLPNYKKLKIVKGDVVNENLVKQTVKDQEMIFNLAALPFIPDSYYYPMTFFQVNTIGTMNVLWSAIKSKSVDSFVQISTSEVYGSAQYFPMDENHHTSPYSTYAVSKLAADRATFTLHKENGFPVVILRPFNTYGPNFTEPYIIPEIITQIQKRTTELTLGNTNSTRDFTYVSDTVNAFLKAADQKNAIGEIINIGSGNEIKIINLANKLIKFSKKKIKVRIDESRLRPYDVDRLICDSKKARTILKWKPKISLNVGLKKTFDWAVKNKVEFSAPFKRWYYKNSG